MAPITAYTLPPDRDKKARAISRVRLRMEIFGLVYGLVMLLLVSALETCAKIS